MTNAEKSKGKSTSNCEGRCRGNIFGKHVKYTTSVIEPPLRKAVQLGEDKLGTILLNVKEFSRDSLTCTPTFEGA